MEEIGDWTRYYSEDGRPYYHNRKSNEVSWSLPESDPERLERCPETLFNVDDRHLSSTVSSPISMKKARPLAPVAPPSRLSRDSNALLESPSALSSSSFHTTSISLDPAIEQRSSVAYSHPDLVSLMPDVASQALNESSSLPPLPPPPLPPPSVPPPSSVASARASGRPRLPPKLRSSLRHRKRDAALSLLYSLKSREDSNHSATVDENNRECSQMKQGSDFYQNDQMTVPQRESLLRKRKQLPRPVDESVSSESKTVGSISSFERRNTLFRKSVAADEKLHLMNESQSSSFEVKSDGLVSNSSVNLSSAFENGFGGLTPSLRSSISRISPALCSSRVDVPFGGPTSCAIPPTISLMEKIDSVHPTTTNSPQPEGNLDSYSASSKGSDEIESADVPSSFHEEAKVGRARIIRMFDIVSQMFYFWNVDTNETEWEAPNEVFEDDESVSAAPKHLREAFDRKNQHSVENVVSSKSQSRTDWYRFSAEADEDFILLEPDASSSVVPPSADPYPMIIFEGNPSISLADYASQYFKPQRAGLFKKKKGIGLLRYQSSGHKPLHVFDDPRAKEKAYSLVESISEWTGDFRSKQPKSDLEVIQRILLLCIEEEDLRNEAFCFLIRQTTENPNRSSEIRGWQLMVLCAKSFPPMREFVEIFLSWLASVSRLFDPDISRLSRLVFTFVEKTLRDGPRFSVPGESELIVAKQLPLWMPIFGVTLDEYMLWQKRIYPSDLLPRILVIALQHLEKLGGMSVEGIFRVPGDVKVVHELKEHCMEGNFAAITRCSNVHVCASLFKLWMRELAEPIIPIPLYNTCLSVYQDPDSCVDLIRNHLSEQSRFLLRYVLRFLHRMTKPEIQAKTRMGTENLAVVFCPNLLRGTSDDPRVIMRNSSLEHNFVRNLIEHAKEL